MKTRLSESEAEAETPANRRARSPTLSLAYSSASAWDSHNAVFTWSLATELQAESVFCFRLRRFNFHWIMLLYASDYDSDYDSVASEKQPQTCLPLAHRFVAGWSQDFYCTWADRQCGEMHRRHNPFLHSTLCQTALKFNTHRSRLHTNWYVIRTMYH